MEGGEKGDSQPSPLEHMNGGRSWAIRKEGKGKKWN